MPRFRDFKDVSHLLLWGSDFVVDFFCFLLRAFGYGVTSGLSGGVHRKKRIFFHLLFALTKTKIHSS